jgi:CPA1 family monovalent cation:H+ antiporter
VIFLLNGFIFILIGMQMPMILKDLGDYRAVELIIYGLIVSVVTIAVRIIWVFGSAYSLFTRKQNETWKGVLIVAWTGTRGVVSLATALALPLTLANGQAFPQRSLILFLAFTVIFVTLVVQGTSLPLLIKMLRLRPTPVNTDQEKMLRLLIANQVVSFVNTSFTEMQHQRVKERVQTRYQEAADILGKELAEVGLEKEQEQDQAALLHINSEINKFRRELLIRFHKEGKYDQAIIRRLELELDHDESQLARKESGVSK